MPYVLSRLPLLRNVDQPTAKKRAYLLAFLSALLTLKTSKRNIHVRAWSWPGSMH